MNFRLDWRKRLEIWGGEGYLSFCYLSSFFALINVHTNCPNPRTIPSEIKVCVVVVVGVSKVSLVLALVKTYSLGFDFGLEPSRTKLIV